MTLFSLIAAVVSLDLPLTDHGNEYMYSMCAGRRYAESCHIAPVQRSPSPIFDPKSPRQITVRTTPDYESCAIHHAEREKDAQAPRRLYVNPRVEGSELQESLRTGETEKLPRGRSVPSFFPCAVVQQQEEKGRYGEATRGWKRGAVTGRSSEE